MTALLAASPGARELHFPRADDEAIHVVGFVERWLDVLGLKIPRALCGVSLEGDPDRPSPGFNAPVCRRCAEIEGR